MIDCDVHCAPASWAALKPYLAPGWWRFVEEHQHGDGPSGVALAGLPYAYPKAAFLGDALAAPGPVVPSSYEELCERYLDRSSADFVLLNCASTFDANRNPYFQKALAAALNDWLRDEWLARDPRLRASVVVPWIDADGAVEEIERVGCEPGFVQVLLPVRAEAPWGQKPFHGLFEAAAERELAVGLHAWGPPNHADNTKGYTTTYVEDYLSNATIAQQHLISLVAEGVLGKFPDLRFVVAECGFTWLPTLLWRLDKDWKGLWPEVPWVQEKPSISLRRSLGITTAPAHLGGATPEFIRESVEMTGAGMLLYASDYPHDHGPDGLRLLDALDDTTRDAIVDGNARRLFDLPRVASNVKEGT
ncbi:MAG TPA: amidohydrolase family protein [Rugosimonospora sp.]|nr:amidohydrolase family protein [Rugosimonospora sp.]